MRSLIKTFLVLMCIAWAACAAASADVVQFGITQDTYIDGRLKPGYNDQSTNFANANVARVAVNKIAAGEDIPGSPARSLFYLPADVWSYSASQIVSATVNFYTWSDKSQTYDIFLRPMTADWVLGSGAVPADGATWLTCDGTNSWTTEGGDFDASRSVTATKGPDLGAGDRFFTWDITSLLDGSDAVARTELQNYGAMLIITEIPPSSGWRGAAFSSYEDPVAINRPYVELDVAPAPPVSEPASASLLGLAGVGLLSRRRRS